MPTKPYFEKMFLALRAILKKHAAKLSVAADKPGNYYLNAGTRKDGMPLCFGAAKINKSYVSFHLMPVYCCPDLLEGMSDTLQARMQGKSCFNFKKIEASQIKELTALTKAGLERFKQAGFLEDRFRRAART
jgi:hypothetical protein